MSYLGALGDSDYVYEDFVAALESWFQRWYTFRDSYAIIPAGQSSRTENATHSVEQHTDDSRLSEQMVSGGSHYEIELFTGNFRERWIQHFEEEERERLKRRRFLKQESLSSLEDLGVGSSDHLSGLSLEQLQEMQTMAHEHDARYWPNREQRMLPLEWLDNLCG